MRPHQHRSDCMPLIFSPVGSLCCILAAPEAHSAVGPAASPILVTLGDPFFLNKPFSGKHLFARVYTL